MQPSGRKRGRAPFGDVSNSNALDSQVVGYKELKRERDRTRSASMTDEKSSERNKKRRESYRRKKTEAANKENNIEIDQPSENDVCLNVGCMDHTQIDPSYVHPTIASGSNVYMSSASPTPQRTIQV
ncbi:hypothetical protein PAHAL_6G193000 [Panicum hallii]|uniref:Uncharacterized protein n=1 Tax=Panicum hallii TaxID=206008 RepID=A0A2T8IH02_9POAL|nr:hypothetical protein PAHAL_6G193000 [Panicum hallii]